MKQFNGPSRQRGFISGFVGGILGALGSGIAGNRAAKENFRAQRHSEGLTAPFRGAGEEVINPLVQLAINGPESDLTRTAGFKDIQNSAAARGKLFSGGTLKELVQFNNQLDEQDFNSRFGALFNIAALGSNAATNQATTSAELISGAGAAKAGGILGASRQLGDQSFLQSIFGG